MTKRKTGKLQIGEYVWCYECGKRLGKWDGSDTMECPNDGMVLIEKDRNITP